MEVDPETMSMSFESVSTENSDDYQNESANRSYVPCGVGVTVQVGAPKRASMVPWSIITARSKCREVSFLMQSPGDWSASEPARCPLPHSHPHEQPDTTKPEVKMQSNFPTSEAPLPLSKRTMASSRCWAWSTDRRSTLGTCCSTSTELPCTASPRRRWRACYKAGQGARSS